MNVLAAMTRLWLNFPGPNTSNADAAVWFASQQQDEDLSVMLLTDIRTLFNACGADRMPSKTLIDDLNAMDDAPWSAWRDDLAAESARTRSCAIRP